MTPRGVARVVWCALAVLVATRAMADTPHERAQRLLRQPEYAFCHDGSRLVRPGDVRFCGYVDVRSACPEFAHACDRLNHPPSCGAPRDLGAAQTMGRVILLAAVLSIAGALLFLTVRSILRARRERDLRDVVPEPDERASLIPVPAAGSSELFARALEAHARGEHGAALYALYGALLRKLDERGAIHIDPTATNGDYVRRCKEPEARGPLRETVREVERVRFGGATATGELFDMLRARVEPIVRAVGVVLVALALGGSLHGCKPSDGSGVSGDTGAGGHRVVREVLDAEGISTRVLVEPADEVEDTHRVLVLDDTSVELDASQWQHVLAWVHRGGLLVVAGGGWPDALGEHTRAHDADGLQTTVGLDPAMGGGGVVATVRSSSPGLDRRAGGFTIASYIHDDAPYAARVLHGSGEVLVLASPELLTNGGFAVGQNADFVVAMLRAFAGNRPVYFVEDAAGGESNPIRSLARAGLLPAVLEGLLALALFYVMVGRHFSTPRDRAVLRRRAFAEHVVAVGGLYARARASRTALRAYTTLLLERVRERSAASPGGLVEAIATRTGEPRDEVERVYNAAERAQAADATPAKNGATEVEDLRLIKRLNEWMNKFA